MERERKNGEKTTNTPTAAQKAPKANDRATRRSVMGVAMEERSKWGSI